MDPEARRLELLRRVSTHAIGEVAAAFVARAIPCAPLKGALHAALDGPTRLYQDADLLVPPATRRASDAALRALGYRPWSVGLAATAYVHPERPLPLDVHYAPFPWGLFDLGAEDLFRRARVDASPFGAPVWVLDPLDDYALLVGHFVKDRRDVRDAPCLAEVQGIRRRGALRPEAVARHLDEAGLARAARYVHGVLADVHADAFAGAVLDALPPDPRGVRLAHLSRAWVGRVPRGGRAAAPATHLLDVTLARGLRSLAAHGLDSGRMRLPRGRPSAAER